VPTIHDVRVQGVFEERVLWAFTGGFPSSLLRRLGTLEARRQHQERLHGRRRMGVQQDGDLLSNAQHLGGRELGETMRQVEQQAVSALPRVRWASVSRS